MCVRVCVGCVQHLNGFLAKRLSQRRAQFELQLAALAWLINAVRVTLLLNLTSLEPEREHTLSLSGIQLQMTRQRQAESQLTGLT